MKIKILSAQEEVSMKKNAKLIASIKEFSKAEDCEISAKYYFVDKNVYLEVVNRRYLSNSIEDTLGRFVYESPDPVIFSLLHSCDKKHHKKAEKMFRDELSEDSQISIQLPKKIKNLIENLAKKNACSIDLMIFNLINQGLDSEAEITEFYEDYERRTKPLSRKDLENMSSGNLLIESKEQI